MTNCPVCGLALYFCKPDIFMCPTGHYALRVTLSQTDHTTYSGGLGNTIPRNWEDPPARTPVPQAFQDAFGEMLEP